MGPDKICGKRNFDKKKFVSKRNIGLEIFWSDKILFLIKTLVHHISSQFFLCSPFCPKPLLKSLGNKFISQVYFAKKNHNFYKGSHHKKKTKKFGKNSQIGLTQPPLGYFRLFWISDIFENCWPPPLGSNWDIFEFLTFLIKVILQTILSNN